MLSAIVIVGPENQCDERCADTAGKLLPTVNSGERGTPLVYVEVLGRSVIERLIDELQRGGVEKTSVYQGVAESSSFPDIHSASPIEFCSAENAWTGAAERLAACKDSGAEALVVARAAAYVELDLNDALQFHREQAQAVTRAFDEEGPLDMWLIDPSRISDDVDMLSEHRGAESARYFVRGYVNRLRHPGDLRRLAVDGLTARCGLRPKGTESRPGVWMYEGAQVHRDARIVAPAFIGRGTRIAEQSLVTRCSNVESNCVIDYGTVVEDSSILSNTYVGIGLDVAHSIVDGNNLLNLERGVSMEIADPCVCRQNRLLRPGGNLRSPVSFGVGSAPLVQAE